MRLGSHRFNVSVDAAPSAMTPVANLRLASGNEDKLTSNISMGRTIICVLDLAYTLFVGSFYTVDLSQS